MSPLVTINGWAITAPFGSIDPSHPVPHRGVDFGIPLGTPVPSIGNGVITAVTNEGNKSFGLSVHERLSDGTDVIMGHLSKVYVHAGQHVKAGEILAASGSTGDSTGPHLHLQTMINGQPVDPSMYLALIQFKYELLNQAIGLSQIAHSILSSMS